MTLGSQDTRIGTEGDSTPAAKRPRTEESAAAEPPAAAEAALGGEGLSAGLIAEEEDLDALLDNQSADLVSSVAAGSGASPPEPADEVARRHFADQVTKSRCVEEEELPDLLKVLQQEAPEWAAVRRWRSMALLLACMSRSRRVCRAAFVADGGLPILGALLQQAVATLEHGDPMQRQEAGRWTLACLSCLGALPLGRTTLWEHRQGIGKPFDRLHKWCGREHSALAAELRSHTSVLCKRWKRQPRPVGQEHAPEQKAHRSKVVEVIAQGLLGIPGGNSPASPAPVSSPGAHTLPVRLVAAEVEAALFGRHGGITHDYKMTARMLRSNLALSGNAKLRERVLSGDLPAEELVAMDSAHLAPDDLQEKRHEADIKNMKESVLTQYIPKLPSKDGNDSPTQQGLNAMAPPLWIKSPAVGSSSQGELEKATREMEPPPTPFREGGPGAPHHQGEDAEHHAEVLATPALHDEDEELETLIRYLKRPMVD